MALMLLVGSCEAYSLGVSPVGTGTRALSPHMSYDHLSKPVGLTLDYEDFRYGVGRVVPRALGGDASTSITTGVGNRFTAADATRDASGNVYSAPPPPIGVRTRGASKTFKASFGDNA